FQANLVSKSRCCEKHERERPGSLLLHGIQYGKAAAGGASLVGWPCPACYCSQQPFDARREPVKLVERGQEFRGGCLRQARFFLAQHKGLRQQAQQPAMRWA
ncbi:MAG TPA: hypothetical protein VHM88_09520, partial [Candidatus Acidoferrales bacterium]|nr:hypothetical protein [Candidatus Acidoferrales bacterium]